MSNRITITITIDLPEGAVASVSNGEELHTLPPVRVVNGNGPVAVAGAVDVICGIHHTPMRQGRYGPFCTKKADPGQPADAKGYCAWKP